MSYCSCSTIQRVDPSRLRPYDKTVYERALCDFRVAKGFAIAFLVLGVAALILGILASKNGAFHHFQSYQKVLIGVGPSLLLLALVLWGNIRVNEQPMENHFIKQEGRED